MRLPLAVPFLLAAPGALAGCAQHRPIASAPPPQTSLGAPDVFGPGVVTVSRDADAVMLDVTTSAYVMVVRVFPGDHAELAYPSAWNGRWLEQPRFTRGTHRVPIVVERNTMWTGSPVEGHWALGSQPPPIIAPRSTGRRWRNCLDADEWAYRAGPLRSTPVLVVQQPCTQSGWQTGRWVAGTPVPLGEHYLIVIAAEAPFDPIAAIRRLNDLDISLASGDAAARAVPGYLLGEDARWAAWIVHRP